MNLGDTIAAVATARCGSRGIVRVSGPGTRGVLDSVCVGFDHAELVGRPVGRRLVRLGDAALPASVMAFRGPRSFTGQDSAEIVTVGNPLVLERVLDAVIAAGARRATPGEFSARAYLNGKLTLAEAEGLAARIAANRDTELAAAERVRSGAFGERCDGWADRLAGLLALVEAGIDFTDQEDVVAIPADRLAAELDDLAVALGGVLGDGGASESAHAVPNVVLVGPPNAGKSTLFNALVGSRRSVVSDVAGTTRDAVAEVVDLGAAGSVRLVDLPGLDGAVGLAGASGGLSADAAAQETVGREIESADLLIACDPRGVFGDVVGLDDRAALRVVTKADLVETTAAGGRGDLAVCALDGWHLDQLRESIADHAVRRSHADDLIPRHRRALAAAWDDLQAARDLVAGRDSLDEPELVASLLRGALDEIGSVSGRVSPDAVLGRVFASFCVGK